MIIVAGTITMDPEKVDVALEAIKKVMEETHKEEGNSAYNFARDISSPGVFHIFEKWDSEDALTSHLSAPHMAEFMGAMGEFGVTDASVLKYEVSSESNAF